MPFATAARLLGWQTGEPGLLSATTLRTVVRDHGGRIRSLEQTEAVVVLRQHRRGRRLRGVPRERTRRRPGWPEELSAAVEEALAQRQICPPRASRGATGSGCGPLGRRTPPALWRPSRPAL